MTQERQEDIEIQSQGEEVEEQPVPPVSLTTEAPVEGLVSEEQRRKARELVSIEPEPEEEEEEQTDTRRFSLTPSVETGLEKAGSIVLGEPKPKLHRNDLSELFAVPEEHDNDMETSDLFEVDDQSVYIDGDITDLVDVTRDDIVGKTPRPARPPRVNRRYTPPTSVRGVRNA